MEPEKRGRGRPPVEGFYRTITMRLTVEDAEQFFAVARKQGSTRSDLFRGWIRRAANEAREEAVCG